MKSIFRIAFVTGLTWDKTYNNDEKDFDATEKFYELDLTKLEHDTIQDNFFDFIRKDKYW